MENKATVSQKAPLYDRLGAEPRLREIVDDVIDRIADDPFLEHYFHDVDKGRIKILAYEYFSMQMGGPDPYTGPDLHSTFFSMNVRPEEYDYVLDDTIFILDEKGIGQPERKEILDILEGLRGEIVRVRAV